MATHVDLQEFVLGFVIEAEEYLDSVNCNLVSVSDALRDNRAEPRAIRELFRALHTIKGLASMVGADPIAAIAHEMESILRTAEKAGGRVSDRTLDLLMQGTRAVEERVRMTSSKGVAGISPAPPQLLEALALSQSSVAPLVAPKVCHFEIPENIRTSLAAADLEQLNQALNARRRVVIIDFAPSPERAAAGINITTVRERLAAVGVIIKVVPRSSTQAPTGIMFSMIVETDVDPTALLAIYDGAIESLQEIAPCDPAESSLANSPEEKSVTTDYSEALDFDSSVDWTPSDQSSVRVDIRRLDEALERLSELVVTRSKLARAVAEISSRGVDTRELNTVLAENNRQLKRLRAAITKARMVPLAELLQRLPLVVRGLTKDSEKSVNLVIQVGAAEVDKAVADKIFPAIVHLIRNAVDHAIEPRKDRKSANKSETATITVRSDDSSGTNLMLTISDDGRGIDAEAVSRRSGKSVARNEDELLQQIALPGLSTKDGVTLTSGRGMGMDIVKRSIEMLGGQLSLQTVQHKGTTFVMRVPISITIVDVLSFVSAGQTFAVPIAMIEEIIEIESNQLVSFPSPGRALSSAHVQPQLIQRRGKAIPYLALDALLYHRDAQTSNKALVVNQHRGGAIAFGVDRMLGQQEAVVRPLDDVLVRGRGMAGATDLGDGKPTIVLDLASLGAAFVDGAVVAQ